MRDAMARPGGLIPGHAGHHEERTMPHRNFHRQERSAGNPEAGNEQPTVKKEQRVVAEKMAQEFPTYDALDDGRPGGGVHRIEHRADAARMSRAFRGLGVTADGDALQAGEGAVGEDSREARHHARKHAGSRAA